MFTKRCCVVMRPVPVVRKGQSDPQLSCTGLVRGSSLLTGPERETRFLDSSHSCVHGGGGAHFLLIVAIIYTVLWEWCNLRYSQIWNWNEKTSVASIPMNCTENLIYVSQKWNYAASFQIPTFMYLWRIYIFSETVCLFGCSKLGRP